MIEDKEMFVYESQASPADRPICNGGTLKLDEGDTWSLEYTDGAAFTLLSLTFEVKGVDSVNVELTGSDIPTILVSVMANHSRCNHRRLISLEMFIISATLFFFELNTHM